MALARAEHVVENNLEWPRLKQVGGSFSRHCEQAQGERPLMRLQQLTQPYSTQFSSGFARLHPLTPTRGRILLLRLLAHRNDDEPWVQVARLRASKSHNWKGL